MAPRNLKYKSFTIAEKLEAIKDIESGQKNVDVALKHGMKPNTLSCIYKNKDKLRESLLVEPSTIKKKRLRNGQFPKVEEAIKTFVTQARSANLPVTGNLIKKKAEQFGNALGTPEFKASNGWFSRFINRNEMKYRCLTGDAAEANQVVAADWLKTTLTPLISRYDYDDIYNADETAFFYKCLPGKVL